MWRKYSLTKMQKNICKSMWIHTLHGAVENQLQTVMEYYFVFSCWILLCIIIILCMYSWKKLSFFVMHIVCLAFALTLYEYAYERYARIKNVYLFDSMLLDRKRKHRLRELEKKRLDLLTSGLCNSLNGDL